MNKRRLTLLVAALLLLTLAACKTEEEPTITTFEDVPGVMLVPDDFWDETEPANAETTGAEEKVEQTVETTVPAETEKSEDPTTAPEKENTEPSAPAVKVTEYEWYHALSGEEQMAYLESFDSIDAFFDWYNAAKAEYEELHPSIEIGDGMIDLEDLVGGNG